MKSDEYTHRKFDEKFVKSTPILILQNFVVGRKCRALYDCEADNEDELTFEEGDIIVVINEDTEDENWMEGCLLSDPSKRGLFPVSFVNMVEDS